MKLLVVLAALAALAGAVSVEEKLQNNCFPKCTWNCDRPSCPAVCEPQCEKPNCELRCEQLKETQCDIRCERPRCEVRCSRQNCQEGGCPLCENVCMPARCQTVCTPQTPVCKPMCSPPRCTWSCRKPTLCPKPKCTMECESRAGGCPKSQSGSSRCCSCNKARSLLAALEIANAVHVQEKGAHPEAEMLPELIELSHEMRLREHETGRAQCCPCDAEEDSVAMPPM